MIVILHTLYCFRDTILNLIGRLLAPYCKSLPAFRRFGEPASVDEEDQVYAEYDLEKGVVFFPPVYAQRYAAISDCLLEEKWHSKIEMVVDLGYHDISFIKYLKEVPGIHTILGVDIEMSPLHCSKGLMGYEDYVSVREDPLKVVLFQGNAADPDYRLIGCDAVVAIEMIEHMLPHDLERLVHTVFGFIKPWVAIFTTPNADFNVLFKAMEPNGLRRWDHFFEWSREQFNDWCSNIVLRYPQYTVSCKGVGPGPNGTSHLGCCSQLAMFESKDYQKQMALTPDSLALVSKIERSDRKSVSSHLLLSDLDPRDSRNLTEIKLNCTTIQVKKFSEKSANIMANTRMDSMIHTREVIGQMRHLTKMLNLNRSSEKMELGKTVWNNINWGENAPYWNQYFTTVKEYEYPFEVKSDENRILDLVSDEIHRLIDMQDDDGLSIEIGHLEIPIQSLMRVVKHITEDVDRVKEILEWNGYEVVGDLIIHTRLVSEEGSVGHTEDDWPDTSSATEVKNK